MTKRTMTDTRALRLGGTALLAAGLGGIFIQLAVYFHFGPGVYDFDALGGQAPAWLAAIGVVLLETQRVRR